MIRRRKPIARSPVVRSAKPLKRKRAKPRRGSQPDEAYKAWIRTLPCLACYASLYRLPKDFAGLTIRALAGLEPWNAEDGTQRTPTEAAHIGLTTSRRGLSRKFPDRETAPICQTHHRTGTDSIHRLGADKFFARNGLDRDAVIRELTKLWVSLK